MIYVRGYNVIKYLKELENTSRQSPISMRVRIDPKLIHFAIIAVLCGVAWWIVLRLSGVL